MVCKSKTMDMKSADTSKNGSKGKTATTQQKKENAPDIDRKSFLIAVRESGSTIFNLNFFNYE